MDERLYAAEHLAKCSRASIFETLLFFAQELFILMNIERRSVSMPHVSQQTDQPFELGVFSFVEFDKDPVTGVRISGAQRMAELLETIELADQVGLEIGRAHV